MQVFSILLAEQAEVSYLNYGLKSTKKIRSGLQSLKWKNMNLPLVPIELLDTATGKFEGWLAAPGETGGH